MLEITHPTVRLFLVVTPPADAARDDVPLAERVRLLDAALTAVKELARSWPSTRSHGDCFEDFEARLPAAVRHIGCAATEVMLASAEAKLCQTPPGMDRKTARKWLRAGKLPSYVRWNLPEV